MSCPFCGLDPYEYVDVGVGGRGVPVAVTCCEFGIALFDDRSEDKRWFKLMERILDELGEMEPGEAKMTRAGELLDRLQPSAAEQEGAKEK